MTKLTLNKIYDARNIGQLEDRYPLCIYFHCSSNDGAEYKGWYYPTDDRRCYLFKNGTWKHEERKYYFHQSKLSSGKSCSRKVTSKISKMIVDLIEANKSSVRDYSFDWERAKSS